MREILPLPPGWPGAAWPHRRPFLQAPRHRHDELEANLVLAGSASYLCGERRVDVRAGDLLWLFPAETHVLVRRSDDFAMWILVFAPALVRRVARGVAPWLAAAEPPSDRCRPLAPAWRRELARVAALLETGARGRAPHPGLATGGAATAGAGFAFLLRLAADAFAAAAAGGAAAAVHPAVARAARRLAEDPTLSLAALARECGLGGDRLARRFRAETGTRLVQHRARMRLERALDLARGGDANLLRCALAAGFGSYMQFHRVFRARFGVGPRAWFAAEVPGPRARPAAARGFPLGGGRRAR